MVTSDNIKTEDDGIARLECWIKTGLAGTADEQIAVRSGLGSGIKDEDVHCRFLGGLWLPPSRASCSP